MDHIIEAIETGRKLLAKHLDGVQFIAMDNDYVYYESYDIARDDYTSWRMDKHNALADWFRFERVTYFVQYDADEADYVVEQLVEAREDDFSELGFGCTVVKRYKRHKNAVQYAIKTATDEWANWSVSNVE